MKDQNVIVDDSQVIYNPVTRKFNHSLVAKNLFSRMVSQSKVSRPKFQLDDVSYILNILNGVNERDQYAIDYQGYRFDELLIPDCFKDWVMPAKVGIKIDTKYRDLRDRRWFRSEEMEKVDLGKLANIADMIYSSYKLDTKVISVEGLRKSVTVNECNVTVIDDDGNCMMVSSTDGHGFIPVPIVDEMSVSYGPHVMNENADWVINQYIRDWRIS